jgi:hypothetical protein
MAAEFWTLLRMYCHVPTSANQLQSLAVLSLGQMAYNLYSYFKREADAGVPSTILPKRKNVLLKQACDISTGIYKNY